MFYICNLINIDKHFYSLGRTFTIYILKKIKASPLFFHLKLFANFFLNFLFS
jgi:hypothetical protein